MQNGVVQLLGQRSRNDDVHCARVSCKTDVLVGFVVELERKCDVGPLRDAYRRGRAIRIVSHAQHLRCECACKFDHAPPPRMFMFLVSPWNRFHDTSGRGIGSTSVAHHFGRAMRWPEGEVGCRGRL